jgi:hypothetical protein
MSEVELSDYLLYEQDLARQKHGYEWRAYNGNYIQHLLSDDKMCEFMLAQLTVQRYPWLVSLFTDRHLSAFVKSRHEHGLPVTYVDHMGPGNPKIFPYEIPDKIVSISLVDGNEIKAPADFLDRTERVFANAYDVRGVLRGLRQKNFVSAEITTETGQGPLWRFTEKELICNFPLPMVWEHYFFMFRTMYGNASREGSVMLIQIPSINTRNPELLNDDDLDDKLSDYLNAQNVPTYIQGDIMICVKTHESPAKLRRFPQ